MQVLQELLGPPLVDVVRADGDDPGADCTDQEAATRCGQEVRGGIRGLRRARRSTATGEPERGHRQRQVHGCTAGRLRAVPRAARAATRRRAAVDRAGDLPRTERDERDDREPQDHAAERRAGDGAEGARLVGLLPSTTERDPQGQHADEDVQDSADRVPRPRRAAPRTAPHSLCSSCSPLLLLHRPTSGADSGRRATFRRPERSGDEWGRWGLNPRPTDYESAALTG